MKKVVLWLATAFAIGALATWAKAHAGDDTIYVMPKIPSEAEKVEALRLGYVLNGFSMKRELHQGSIDVSGLMGTPAPGVVRTIPIRPEPKKAKQ
jgi:hypothetical protein